MKKYLVCIDSDGCAIDSMEIKHRRCFGPLIVEVWGLNQWKDAILDRWNEINLYSRTRGINRFLGLEMMLTEIDQQYCTIDGLAEYSAWCKSTETYSNAALSATGNLYPIFRKVLDWSNRVNRDVAEISGEICPFDRVKEALEKIHQYADIAIVSSANPQAVHEEWSRFGFMELVDYVMAQDAGTKAECIHALLERGYEKNCTMMVGDAPGDHGAAKANDVLYYPIVPGHEVDSWQRLTAEAFDKFFRGEYAGAYMNSQISNYEQVLI